MRLEASGDVAQVVEAAIGGVLLGVVLTLLGLQVLRWWRARRRVPDDPRVPALARFADSETTDARTFGGGAWSARVRRRRDTVTYGYLAVAEEHVSADSGGRWCTLTVTLPGRVPFLAVDNRAAAGRTGRVTRHPCSDASHGRSASWPRRRTAAAVAGVTSSSTSRLLGVPHTMANTAPSRVV